MQKNPNQPAPLLPDLADWAGRLAAPLPVADARKKRTDGVEARRHLVLTALRLFSATGYAKTSIRTIALAAGVNVASISYYFGDKAGLYRAVFTEPFGDPHAQIALFDHVDLSLRQSLGGFIDGFLAPMKQGELVQQCTRLHFREMLEPTGVWAHEIDTGIKPAHAALTAMLARHLKLAELDDDLHRLSFSIVGLALHLFMARDVVAAIQPQLLATPDAIDTWSARLVGYAEAMVAAEAARRASLSSVPPAPSAATAAARHPNRKPAL